MEAILFVGHGSKDSEGNQALINFTEKVEKAINQVRTVPIMETCFLELTTPTVAAGISKCLESGAKRIALVPIILFSAGDANIDIPGAIDLAKKNYPEVEFSYGRPILIHVNIMQLLTEGLQALGYEKTEKRDHNSAILMIGRGSSDPDANSEFYKVLRYLWERTSVKWVEPAFMGITEPTFPEGIECCINSGAKNIYILPYFLFTGVLIKRMAATVDEYRQKYPQINFQLANPFGLHDLLIEVIKERGLEALDGASQLNCDMCPHRLGSVSHHHHHDHHDHHRHDHGHGGAE